MAVKGTVLVVDNESDQLRVMKKLLGRIGYAAKTTEDPREAVEMVAREAFNLVFIDLIMPEIDGTELCEQIKLVRPTVPVYAFSGHVHLYDSRQLERAGFDGMIGKPATMEEISTVLSGARKEDYS